MYTVSQNIFFFALSKKCLNCIESLHGTDLTKNTFLQVAIFRIWELAMLSSEHFIPVDISIPDLWHRVIPGLKESTNGTPPDYYKFSEFVLSVLLFYRSGAECISAQHYLILLIKDSLRLKLYIYLLFT
jgi:hypothetical protein